MGWAWLWLVMVMLLRPQVGWSEDGLDGFESNATASFDFRYRARYLPRVRQVMAGAERTRVHMVAEMGFDDPGNRVEVRFARNADELRALSPRRPPEWADAVAFWPEQLLVISLTSTHHRPVSLETVFRHELSHLALRWAVGSAEIPRWFNEGVAVMLSGEQAAERFKLLWPSAARGRHTPLRQLERTFPRREFEATRAYAESADFVRFLSRYQGRWRFSELLQRLRQGEPFVSALEATWDRPLAELERAWHADLHQRYSIIPTLTAGVTLWILVGIGAIVAFVRRRRDIRRRIAELPDDETDYSES
jgi:hypothetical protein